MDTELQGIPETMLQTLHARAMESKKEKPFIYDEKAIEIVDILDYDFSKAEKDRPMYTGVIARTILLDRMVGSFLEEHPGAVVINMASGLDTRCSRMEGNYGRWYNIDLPETMEVRRRFLPENGPTVFQIPRSATDRTWADSVGHTDGPVLVIIEGLTMYLSENDVKTIFSIIKRNFPGSTVFVETMNPFIVKHMKEKSIEGSGAKFSWGVKSGKELASLLPGWKAVGDHSLTEGMKVFIPVYRFLDRIPFVRNISNRITVLVTE